MAQEEKKSRIMEVVAVAALLFLFWLALRKKKVQPSTIEQNDVDAQFRGDPDFNLNDYCQNVVYKPLSANELVITPLLGKGWCARGDRSIVDEGKGFGDPYSEKQAKDYVNMKQGEAILINNKLCVQFRLINTTAAPITTNVLNTTEDSAPFDPILTVTDIDGNIYHVITIGNQQWMVENFRSEHYNDGTAIPKLTLDADWAAEDGTPGHDGAMCYYNNDEATYKPDYGAMYNWYAVNNAHGIAPDGWRVPSDADWNALYAAIGGMVGGAIKLKASGLDHWVAPNNGTDVYGFKFQPTGQRDFPGSFLFDGFVGSLWSSDDTIPGFANTSVVITGNDDIIHTDDDKNVGFSVRLMRDI